MTHQNTYTPQAAGSYLQQPDGSLERRNDDDTLAATPAAPAAAPAPTSPKTVATKEQ